MYCVYTPAKPEAEIQLNGTAVPVHYEHMQYYSLHTYSDLEQFIVTNFTELVKFHTDLSKPGPRCCKSVALSWHLSYILLLNTDHSK